MDSEFCPSKFSTALGIVGMCMGSAIVYGILHDQVTVRVCLEYFTIGHYPIFGDHDPTILAILWGTFSTWWMGVFLGVPLALAATIGKRPILTKKTLRPVVLKLLVVMAGSALLAGILGFYLGSTGTLKLQDLLSRAQLVPADKHAAFFADAFAHDASYLVGFFGGLYVIVRTWIARGKVIEDAQSKD